MYDRDTIDSNQRVVALNSNILESNGIDLSKDAKILDYGCGSGRHTYEYVDAGYKNVSGFDIKDYVDLRAQEDKERFRFIDPNDPFTIPFPDNYFDFIVSTSVFEHVTNQEQSIQEIARVLKPGGVTLHVFPSRWRPIEPHIFVPFGGAIQNKFWLWLWALLGVRNQYQVGRKAGGVVNTNATYCKSGLCYLSLPELENIWSRSFNSVKFVEDSFIDASKDISRISMLAKYLIQFPFGLGLYRFFHTRVVLAQKK
ncbi:MAG: class I SAM-dependent methyltransferase [Candidatus Heimdallarchaeota archaeon]|nr:class I SAM-dependent methyltransferase [Candidatus Heimdallarchaeota archaeon]